MNHFNITRNYILMRDFNDWKQMKERKISIEEFAFKEIIVDLLSLTPSFTVHKYKDKWMAKNAFIGEEQPTAYNKDLGQALIDLKHAINKTTKSNIK